MPSPVKLKRFKPGTALEASHLNLLIDAINAAQPVPGHGINVRNTSGGTLISRKVDPTVGGGSADPVRFLGVALTGGTTFPELAALRSDIIGAYTGSLTPRDGDYLISTAFHWVVGGVSANGVAFPGEDISRIVFTVGSTQKIAFQVGPHRFFSFT